MDPAAAGVALTGAIPESARLARNLMTMSDSYPAKSSGNVPSQKQTENQRKLVEKFQQIRVDFTDEVLTQNARCTKLTSCTFPFSALTLS